MNWIKNKLLYPLFLAGVSIFLVIIILEIILRFLPVRDYHFPQLVNEISPVLKLLPNREIVFSKGWNFRYKLTVKVNNDGFINNQDYIQDNTLPLLSVVGDSYIEALMVPYEKTVHGILAERLNEKAKVYSFAFSGAPLSQYLGWARYAKNKYNNQFLIVNIVGNDFDESLKKYSNYRGGYTYFADQDGKLNLGRIDYNYTTLRFVWESSLIRYLLLNLEAINVVQSLLNNGKNVFVGNVLAEASEERIKDSEKVISAFLRDIPEYSGLPKSRIVICLDGIRPLDPAKPSTYDYSKLPQFEGSYFGVMRRKLLAQAKESGFEVVDLQPFFIEHYKKNKMLFEFPTDGHWNELGHAMLADALLASENLKIFINELNVANVVEEKEGP